MRLPLKNSWKRTGVSRRGARRMIMVKQVNEKKIGTDGEQDRDLFREWIKEKCNGWGFLNHPLVPVAVRVEVIEAYQEAKRMHRLDDFLSLVRITPDRLESWVSRKSALRRKLEHREKVRKTFLYTFLDRDHAIAIWFGVMVVSFLSFMGLDRDVIWFFFEHQSSSLVDVFQGITYLGESFFYLLFSFLAMILCINQNRSCARKAFYLFSAVGLSGLIVNLFKPVLSRFRPEALVKDGSYGFDLFRMEIMGEMAYVTHSFPSGHSATAMSFAVAGLMLWPALRNYLLLFGVTVALSRIIVLKHYPADVIVGSFIGIYTALWIYGPIAGVGRKVQIRTDHGKQVL